MNSFQGKPNPAFEVKKPMNNNKIFAIETSHGKIQMNNLSHEQSPQQNKTSPQSVTSPQKLELKKQDSSGSEVSIYYLK